MTVPTDHPFVQTARDKFANGDMFHLVKKNIDSHIRQIFEDDEATRLTAELEATIRKNLSDMAYDLLNEAYVQQITACCGEDVDAFRAMLWLHANTDQFNAKLNITAVLAKHAERRVYFAWMARTQLFGLALERHPLCRLAYNQLAQ